MAGKKGRVRLPVGLKRVVAAGLPLVLGVAAVAAMVAQRESLPRTEAQALRPEPTFTSVGEEPFIVSARGFGTARAKRLWTAVTEVGGEVVAIHPMLEAGNEVKGGEVLLRIDPTDFQLRFERSEAEKHRLASELRRLQLDHEGDKRSHTIQLNILRNRERELERSGKLTSSQAVTASEYEATEIEVLQQQQVVSDLQKVLDSYESRRAALESSYAAAEAAANEARRDVERTRIFAPFDGLLSNVSLEVGQVLQAGQSIATVLDVKSVEVEAQFATADLRALDGGRLRATVRPATDETGDAAPAEIVRWSESIDERTRTHGVVVEVKNPTDSHRNGLLLPGAFCEVVLSDKAQRRGVVVSGRFIEKGKVFVAGPANKVVKRRVRATPLSDDRVWVREGLSPGDRLLDSLEATRFVGGRTGVASARTSQPGLK